MTKKLFWGVNWKSIFDKLQAPSNNIKEISHGAVVLGNRRQLVEEASLAINWKKRLKDHNTRFVELHTKFMFNKSWKRKQRNYIYMLKNENSIWVDDAQEIELLITKHFQDIYIPNSTLVNDSTQHGEDIYLVL